MNGERVFTRNERTRNGEFVRNKHIVGGADGFSVEIYVADSIYTLKEKRRVGKLSRVIKDLCVKAMQKLAISFSVIDT